MGTSTQEHRPRIARSISNPITARSLWHALYPPGFIATLHVTRTHVKLRTAWAIAVDLSPTLTGLQSEAMKVPNANIPITLCGESLVTIEP